MLAAQKGDFVPVARDDGIRQWTYKGLGLYTFSGDLARGDANGDNVKKGWHIAHVARDFMPDGISVQESERLGKVLADARGRTLYRRDAYLFQSGSGHGQRRGVLMRPAVGRDLGTDPHCMDSCEKWHPLIAPAGAEARGYWNVYTRPDGQKQWAYQGYALWTFDGDTKPGEINGNDSWELAQASARSPQAAFDIGTNIDTVPALYWAATAP
jgi:predicted lipoprotein with Yx(FWY)xxD motif